MDCGGYQFVGRNGEVDHETSNRQRGERKSGAGTRLLMDGIAGIKVGRWVLPFK